EVVIGPTVRAVIAIVRVPIPARRDFSNPLEGTRSAGRGRCHRCGSQPVPLDPGATMSTSFPSARRIATNGIELAVHEAGEGPAVMLLHGFPELPFSWRHQVGPIVDAGFRVLIPAQRGYGDSDAPADSQTYSCKTLVADLVGVLDALDIDQAVFFGHDWGGLPAWYTGVYAADRAAGVGS